jgi:hypothetical protein
MTYLFERAAHRLAVCLYLQVISYNDSLYGENSGSVWSCTVTHPAVPLRMEDRLPKNISESLETIGYGNVTGGRFLPTT